MKLHGKTWLFFAGYSLEYDDWSIRLQWGGKSAERGINGLFNYKRSVGVAYRWPRYSRPRVNLITRTR